MKVEYDGICANVLRQCPLPCKRCAFNCRGCITRCNSGYFLCGRDGFEKDPGYIFKV